MDIVLKYDPKADILSMKLKEGTIKDEKLLDSDIVLGFDEKGELVALEVWDASKRGLLKSLTDLHTRKEKLLKPSSKESIKPLLNLSPVD